MARFTVNSYRWADAPPRQLIACSAPLTLFGAAYLASWRVSRKVTAKRRPTWAW